MPLQWAIIVPVKKPAMAKTRLADAVGALRPAIARAFAIDTVAAAIECHTVAGVVVVTDDDEVSHDMREIGAQVVNDEPYAGLNPALRHGAQIARTDQPDAPVAALSADLPALRATELQQVLDEALKHQASFVADTSGIGTTLYAAAGETEFEPRFGGRSAAAHRASGATALGGDIPTVRRDIDTGVDLADALRLGVGPRTQSVVSKLDLPVTTDSAS